MQVQPRRKSRFSRFPPKKFFNIEYRWLPSILFNLFPFTAIKIWPEAKNCQRRFKMLKETISTLNKYKRLSKFCYLGNTSVSANTITLMFKMMWTWLWPHDWKIKCSERKEFQKRDWRESFKRLSNDGGLIVRVLALLLW